MAQTVMVNENDLVPGFFCFQAHHKAKTAWLVVGRYDTEGTDIYGDTWKNKRVIVMGGGKLEVVFPEQLVYVISDPRDTER